MPLFFVLGCGVRSRQDGGCCWVESEQSLHKVELKMDVCTIWYDAHGCTISSTQPISPFSK